MVALLWAYGIGAFLMLSIVALGRSVERGKPNDAEQMKVIGWRWPAFVIAAVLLWPLAVLFFLFREALR